VKTLKDDNINHTDNNILERNNRNASTFFTINDSISEGEKRVESLVPGSGAYDDNLKFNTWHLNPQQFNESIRTNSENNQVIKSETISPSKLVAGAKIAEAF